MAADEPQSDVDFVRFMGTRVVDGDIDERGCKVVDGEKNIGVTDGTCCGSPQTVVHSLPAVRLVSPGAGVGAAQRMRRRHADGRCRGQAIRSRPLLCR